MSKDLKKNNRRNETITNILMICVLMAPIIMFFGPIAYFVSTPYENVEQEQEAMDNSGYNWTEVNYTTFETKVSCGFLCGTTIAEEQCANGVQEACDYVTIKNVDYHDRNNFEQTSYFVGGTYLFIIVMTSPLWGTALLLIIGAFILTRTDKHR